MTRKLFADRVGRSVAWVDKVERGERALTKLPLLERVADVLQVPIEVLTSDQESVRAAECPDAVELAALREALQRYDAIAGAVLARPGESQEPDLTRLRSQVRYVWMAFQASDYATVSQTLPGLLIEAEQTADALTGSAQNEARHVLAQAYQMVASTARKIGAYDLEWLAADRGIAVVDQVGDLVVVGGAVFRLVNALLDNDGSRAAVETARSAGARLGRGMSRAVPAHLSIYGHVMLQGAMAAAAAQDQATAQELFGEARTMAGLLGQDRNDYWTAFGPTNVVIHEVCALVEAGEPGRAVETAGQLAPEVLAGLPKERHASHLVTLARAYSHAGRREEAVSAVLEADERAPKEVRCRPLARQLVEDLVVRARGKPSYQLQQLAARVGAVA
jgi:transcriptional regulator with XRE-family HTH domain